MGSKTVHNQDQELGEGHVQSRTVSSKGQITISADARRKLSIDEGDRLLEFVVGGYLMYVPEQIYLTRLFDSFQENLRRADLTTEQLLDDMEIHKDETFQELYPDLVDK